MDELTIGTLYSKRVTMITDMNKVFNARGADRHKFVITFEGGYRAEYCPEVTSPPHFKENDVVGFRVIAKSRFGDEIEVEQKQPLAAHETPENTRVIAMQFAVQITSSGSCEKFLLSEIVPLAKSIYEFLKDDHGQSGSDEGDDTPLPF